MTIIFSSVAIENSKEFHYYQLRILRKKAFFNIKNVSTNFDEMQFYYVLGTEHNF